VSGEIIFNKVGILKY